MTKYWLKSKENSIYYYNFHDICIDGILSIDENLNIKLVSAEGRFANNKEVVEEILYHAKGIIEDNFPEKWLYATH